jgi:2-amino-4-hydroxy-6-hydroxymethyldihydropteridine diphosphokinase
LETVYLGLGSNLGNRKKNIESAISELNNAGIKVERISSLVETDPVGGPPQGKFLNAVIKAKTSFSPEDLLEKLKHIEKMLGRKKTIVNGPRTIDIDILLYSRLKVSTPQLTIPHPRMFTRPFVMEPLKEIEPEIDYEGILK